MQKLFHWHSEYLKNYSYGDIVVMAITVEGARAMARKRFEEHYFERYKDLYSSLEAMVEGDPDEKEDLEKARAVFEKDIAQEPMKLPGLIFIEGGE